MTLVQPVIILFVFGRLFPVLGQTSPEFSSVIIPGVIAMTMTLTAITSVTVPLAREFGFTREIEDRLLSPLPTWLVGMEKLLYGVLRGFAAGLFLFPLGWLVLGDWFQVSSDHIGLFLLVATFGALTGAALGLTFGTHIQPQNLGLVFPLILPPMFLTGCVYFPWPSLDEIRWLQILTYANPLTYVCEGLRTALSPDLQHMEFRTVLIGLISFPIVLSVIGLRGFRRKAVD
jgi:ABC-2 type transport system permease protein